MLLDRRDEAFDAAQRRIPDLPRRFRAIAPHQLMQLELAVRCEKAGTAPRRTAADDVLLDQYDLQTLEQKFSRGADTAEAAADDQYVAFDVLGQGWAVLVPVDHESGDPPVLIDYSGFRGHVAPYDCRYRTLTCRRVQRHWWCGQS